VKEIEIDKGVENRTEQVRQSKVFKIGECKKGKEEENRLIIQNMQFVINWSFTGKGLLVRDGRVM